MPDWGRGPNTDGAAWKSCHVVSYAYLPFTPPHSNSYNKKNGYDLHYVETSCTDGIRSNTARIRTGKIMCYSFVFGTLTIEDHIVVLEIFPLLIDRKSVV